MYCVKCGNTLRDGDDYCARCGVKRGNRFFGALAGGFRQRKLVTTLFYLLVPMVLAAATVILGIDRMAGSGQPAGAALAGAPAVTATPHGDTAPPAQTPMPGPKLSIGEEAAMKAMGNYTDNTVVVFADKAVETWIRAHYITTTGPITVGEMKRITEFIYNPDYDVSAFGVIKTLFDLRYCINLEFLAVYKQPISNIESLRGLPNLEYINLQYSGVSDLSPLEGKVSLSIVSIDNNPILDASPVLKLPNLTSFTATGTKITDISALRNSNKLTNFYYTTGRLNDISPLFAHKGLQRVGLEKLTNEEFTALLINLGNLKDITVDRSTIDDASLRLLQGRRLDSLILEECGITDISVLSSIDSLSFLGLYGNSIKDITPLSGLVKIDTIDLTGNKIMDYTPLQNLTSLRTLFITNNPVTSSPVLDKLADNGCDIHR